MVITGWRKDAEAAGRWVADHLLTKRRRTEVSADTLAWIARWAGHWGRKELERLNGA